MKLEKAKKSNIFIGWPKLLVIEEIVVIGTRFP
jgi:hypothetical protein